MNARPSNPSRVTGFTLVELLVAITIIGILVALLLPAVQSVREAGRRVQCENHLKQFALAFHSHLETHGHFPTGGWGYRWMGDPDRGFAKRQPGGWVFNALPYTEQASLYNLAQGLSGAAKQEALAQVNSTPLPLLHCPSRHATRAYPTRDWTFPRNAQFAWQVAKTDYAANAGDGPWGPDAGYPAGPGTIPIGDAPHYPWTSATTETGIVFQRSTVSAAEIRDGLSNTYLLGEKYVNPDCYTSGRDNSDDQSAYVGYDIDVCRWTRVTKRYAYTPLQDRPGLEQIYRFGSTHASGCNFKFCDGSVRTISYGIDPEVNRRLGNRRDGTPVSTSLF